MLSFLLSLAKIQSGPACFVTNILFIYISTLYSEVSLDLLGLRAIDGNMCASYNDTRKEKELLLELSHGDALAFTEIFNKFHTALCAYAKKMVFDSDVSKDIVSEVMVQCWNRRADFRSFASLRTFLYVSTKNASINHIKRSQIMEKHHQSILATSESGKNDYFLESIFEAEVLRHLRTSVSELPHQTRTVISFSMAGLNSNEIAQQLGVSPQTVRNTRRLGIKALIQRMRSSFPSKFGGHDPDLME